MISQITSFKKDKRFLSNFYEVEIHYKGVTYKTLEHAYQAQKAMYLDEMSWVANAATPAEAKYRGNKVHMVKDWEFPFPNPLPDLLVVCVKDAVMYELLEIKFSIPELKKKLLETGNAELIEGNYHHDNYYGQCFCPKCFNKIKWHNKLGRMQMVIRERMK